MVATQLDIVPSSNGGLSRKASFLDSVQIECKVIQVSPELAKTFLSRNLESNRKLNQARIKSYVKRMHLGEWKLSEPLKFNANGDLFDGQHRLHAVIAANISVPFVVLKGYPIESMSCVDIGMTRSLANVAAIEGIHITPLQAGIAVVMQSTITRLASAALNTPQERINLYLHHKEAVDLASRVAGKSSITHASIRAAIAKAYYYEDRERLVQFIRVLDTGFPVNGLEDNAAIAMRTIFIRGKQTKSNAGDGRLVLFRQALTAVKLFCKGKDTKVIREAGKDLYPLP